ncbi:hypothetical protein [Streptomyces fildesensis]|uniref:hypothetical protein n=1 Tax=Streptomyces fildesensis TaxID=375757 RepID=UPI001106F2AD|nr:hypothetical protein [Streptomyces fildesensis]MCZ4103321.1 hypothetical protein [Streptomyces sp. H39-C1]
MVGDLGKVIKQGPQPRVAFGPDSLDNVVDDLADNGGNMLRISAHTSAYQTAQQVRDRLMG